MNRCLAFLCAIVLSVLSISSACVAQPQDLLRFTLQSSRDPGRIQASFSDRGQPGRGDHQWSTGFTPSELVGLDAAGFRAGGNRPLHFAITREAGRVDCAGSGGESYAAGSCTLSPNAAFIQTLAARGVGRPDQEQVLQLVAVDARRSLIDALAAARYQTPDIDKLIELAAVGVSSPYIKELAGQGFRPASLDELVEFRALDITPQFIAGLERAGYRGLKADDLVQLRALDVTPDYIASFAAIGYTGLPVDTLVQLKALNVTADYVRSVIGSGLISHPTPEQMVQLRAMSFEPRSSK